jgi:PPK2 family polyphosphate:nucleotide phosphotransferase
MAGNGRIRRLVGRYRVEEGRRFRLADYDPADTHGIESKERAEKALARGVARLSALQEKLYAQDRWAVLLIFQAMDAAGKDSAIKHVMSGINPQGCEVFSFKAPTADDLDHDFLWRTARCLPERGRIGIFNRSYYEEVLVVRVHPEILARQKLPARLVTKRIWEERYQDIAAHERYLARNGVLILKFFLHVSKAEQKRRFLDRTDEPEKNWKFSSADVRERASWKKYMAAYEDMIRATATPHAPWFVVPADKKWFTRLVVAGAVADAMERLKLAFPVLDAAQKADLAAARRALAGEGRKERPRPARREKGPAAVAGATDGPAADVTAQRPEPPVEPDARGNVSAEDAPDAS